MGKTWEIDFEKTSWRKRQLSEMYQIEGLNARSFSCKHYNSCRESQKGTDIVKQYAGGTAALMPAYDVYYNNQAIMCQDRTVRALVWKVERNMLKWMRK